MNKLAAKAVLKRLKAQVQETVSSYGDEAEEKLEQYMVEAKISEVDAAIKEVEMRLRGVRTANYKVVQGAIKKLDLAKGQLVTLKEDMASFFPILKQIRSQCQSVAQSGSDVAKAAKDDDNIEDYRRKKLSKNFKDS